jgi:hypothetical protein
MMDKITSSTADLTCQYKYLYPPAGISDAFSQDILSSCRRTTGQLPVLRKKSHPTGM